MKRIVIILIGLISVAYGQSSPTSAKTRFVNGLYVGTKLDSYFAAADSNAIYWRADSALMAKYKGTARRLLFVSDTAAMLSGYQTYYPRTAISAGTGISYNAATGVITNSSPSSGGTVTSVSSGTGMSFTTITSSGAVNADTTTLATRAYAAGLDVAKANTSLNNVNGVLSSTYGGAGSVSGILKADGSGVVSAAVAGDITSLISGTYLPLTGGTLTGALNGTSLSMSGIGLFNGAVDDSTNKLIVNGGVKGGKATFEASTNPLESINNTGRQYGRFRTILNGGFIDFISSYGTTPVTAGYIGNGSGISSASETSFGIRSEGDLILMSGGNNIRLTLASSTGAITASSSVTAGNLASNESISAVTSISVSGNTVPKFQINRGTYTTSGLIEYLSNSSLRWTTGLNASQGGYSIYNGSAGANAFNIDTLSNATFASTVYAQGYRFAYAAKSSNYTLTDNDDYINVTSSCTITLPTAVGRSGKRYVIKCVGSVTATIATTSSETIDGNAASTYTFGGPNFNIMIVYSNGTNWNLEAWATGI